MEDEDSENGLVDTWSLWEEAYYKETAIDTSLTQINNSSISLDEAEENREDCFYSAYSHESDGNENFDANLKIDFKVLKKNILKQTLENQDNLFDRTKNTIPTNKLINVEENKTFELKTEKMAEYTQYLGLQPATSKSECRKCRSFEKANTMSESKLNECNCSPTITASQSTTCNNIITPIINNSQLPVEIMCNISKLPSSNISHITAIASEQTYLSTAIDSTTSEVLSAKVSESSSIKNSGISFASSSAIGTNTCSNFKITRKVYLCAACETYFENWNLFLHMRDVHKRHICLFCLGIFGDAERLSYHLSKKHNVPEMTIDSVQDFHQIFKGSCFIVCCSCEKIFSETDNFYSHFCVNEKHQSSFTVCSLCSQVGSHAKICKSVSKKGDKSELVPQLLCSTKSQMTDLSLSNQTVTGTRRHSQRTIKPNRLNDDVYLYTKLTNIRSKKNKDKTKLETIRNNECHTLNFQNNTSIIKSKEFEQKSSNSLLNEKVNQVSKLIDLDCDQSKKSIHILPQDNSYKDKNENKSLQLNHYNEINVKNINDNENETVMDVLQSINKSSKTVFNEMSKEKITDCNPDTVTIKFSDLKYENDIKLLESNKLSPKIKDLSTENKFLLEEDSHSHFESTAFNNHNSSTNQINSIKKQENLPYNKDSSKDEVVKKTITSTTPVTDRSLIIKICTKNNSTFSITTPTMLKKNSIENHDNTGDFEENHNGEDSDNKAFSPKEFDPLKAKTLVLEYNSDSEGDKLDIAKGSESDNRFGIINIEFKDKSDANNQEQNIEKGIGQKNEQEVDNLSSKMENTDGFLLAGEEIPLIDLNVHDLLENIEIEDLLKRCIQAVYNSCVYCNHARHIAVDGKQLSLHMLAEHRFQPQHPAIIIQQEQFITKVKNASSNLEFYYFNLNSFNSKQGSYNVSNVKVYECFHCRFYSSTHKELYLHNRKMHQKPILICIMCKSTFYSYSELLCHLCPGVYAANVNILYRCCLCSLSKIPSGFRLMVHLRKQHHACDVCLELTGNQQRLSNHVWKHKLHHLCYRCGIAYRNKPDITKHLFWKHGTESVLCKKCLQKKWPHIYHFCIPPTAFVCEECGLSFSRAVALKVHKRIHTCDYPYPCSECTEKFISKKLLFKHKESHKIPSLGSQNTCKNLFSNKQNVMPVNDCNVVIEKNSTQSKIISKEIIKKVVDVYDLPPLNLSSESDSEIENEKQKNNKTNQDFIRNNKESTDMLETSKNPLDLEPITDITVEVESNEEERKHQDQIMDGIWDNFKSYTASLENSSMSNRKEIYINTMNNEHTEKYEVDLSAELMALADHDYCILHSNKIDNQSCKQDDTDLKLEKSFSPSAINIQKMDNDNLKKKVKTFKKKKNANTSSSDSSSDSDTSSCSCGTNCSCSSSSSSNSSSSSSSSDSDSSRSHGSCQKETSNRERYKKEKETIKQFNKMEVSEVMEDFKVANNSISNEIEQTDSAVLIPVTIMESDLNTTETDTDEDFYDENPQQLANKLLAEKRNKLILLAAVAPCTTDTASTSLNNCINDTDVTLHSSAPSLLLESSVEASPIKKKVRTRKRKRSSRNRVLNSVKAVKSAKPNILKINHPEKEFVMTSSDRSRYSRLKFVSSRKKKMFSANQMITNESLTIMDTTQSFGGSGSETDVKRSSKRKRIPKRFYGDSSDEENHKQQLLKWRRIVVPPLAVVSTPAMSKCTNYKQSLQQQRLLFQQQHHQLQLQQEQQMQQRQSLQQESAIVSKAEEEEDQEQESLMSEDNVVDDEKVIMVTPSDIESKSETDDSNSNNSSNSEIKDKQIKSSTLLQTQTHYSQLHPSNPERVNNLYCYCQCPYDEVSEMIACDGDDCHIEWFHFECVGIMVPPKGKWYCPDCRRKLGIPDDTEDVSKG